MYVHMVKGRSSWLILFLDNGAFLGKQLPLFKKFRAYRKATRHFFPDMTTMMTIRDNFLQLDSCWHALTLSSLRYTNPLEIYMAVLWWLYQYEKSLEIITTLSFFTKRKCNSHDQNLQRSLLIVPAMLNCVGAVSF